MRRTDQDDGAAVALPDHLLRGRPQQVEGAPHGHIDGAAKAGHVGFVEQFAIAVGRVADGDIEFAKFGNRSLHQVFDGLQLGHIGLDGDGSRAGVSDGLNDLFGGVGVRAIVDHDLGAAASQRHGGGSPDPQTGSRHDGDGALQIHA